MNTGNAAAAAIEPSEEYLQNATTRNHRITAAITASRQIGRNTPRLVATPFPPLNPSQTGNMCPTTAAIAAAVIQRALLLPSAQRLAIRTAAYPLAASRSKVRRPAPSPAL